MIVIKPSSSVNGLKPEILLAIFIATSVYNDFEYNLTITAVTDGKHSKGSLHYVGYAVDIRIRNIKSQEDLNKIVFNIKSALGDEYDVILHATHLHIEFQPKTPINI